MEEVRRADDDELCGHVSAAAQGEWYALTVFGGRLGTFPTKREAAAHVLDEGLAALAAPWFYRTPGDDEAQVVRLLEVRPGWARVALDWYATPDVPVVVVTAEDLAAGHQLELRRP